MENHPIEILSKNLTSFNLPIIREKLVSFDGTCSCCGRKVTEAIIGKNSYKENRNLCIDCSTLFFSDPKVMGWFKPPVLQKNGEMSPGQAVTFGLLEASAGIIPLDSNQKPIIMLQQKTYDRLPDKAREFFDIVPLTGNANRLVYALDRVKPPFIFIRNFGRRAFDFVNNLRITHSTSSLYICDDSEKTDLVDYSAAIKIASILVKEKPVTRNAFTRFIELRAKGDISPLEAVKIAEDNELFSVCARLLPADPHVRLSMTPIINELIKKLEKKNDEVF